MLARTRGPSMKPAWAATTSSAPSENSVSTTRRWASGKPAATFSTSTALLVFPTTDVTSHSR